MSIVPGRDVPAVPEEWTDAVNKAINDAHHEDLCMCDGWPDACASGYESGRWDLGVSLDIAVGALAPLMRARESERGDHWKRVATEIEQDRDRLAARVAELEGEREQLRDEYGIRYKDPDLAHTWHTTWGFSSAEDARGFLAENVQLPGEVLHRLVGEPQPAAAPDRAEGNER